MMLETNKPLGMRTRRNGPRADDPAAHFPGADYLVHHLLGLPIADSEPASLVIRAIRTGDQLAEGA